METNRQLWYAMAIKQHLHPVVLSEFQLLAALKRAGLALTPDLNNEVGDALLEER